MKQSRIRATTSVSHPTDQPTNLYLLQSIEIHCEDCGGVQQLHIIGHHIPAVMKILQKALEQYPELCRETVMEIPPGGNLAIPPGGGGRIPS